MIKRYNEFLKTNEEFQSMDDAANLEIETNDEIEETETDNKLIASDSEEEVEEALFGYMGSKEKARKIALESEFDKLKNIFGIR